MENKTGQINLNQGKKKAAIWLILAGIVFCALIFAIWLSFGKIKQGSEDILFAKSVFALSGIQEKEIENFKAKYQEYLPVFQRIDQSIVDPKNPLNFIEFLESSADADNVALVIFPMSFSKTSELKTLSVQLTAKGEFAGILSFLKKMENGRYLISVQNLVIEEIEESKPNAKSVSKITRANISINVLTRQ